jgi:hypothetical protein
MAPPPPPPLQAARRTTMASRLKKQNERRMFDFMSGIAPLSVLPGAYAQSPSQYCNGVKDVQLTVANGYHAAVKGGYVIAYLLLV